MNWTKISLSSTWGNAKYRKAMIIALSSSLSGSLSTVILLTGNSYIWVVLLSIVHALLIHILSFELAHDSSE